MFATVPDARTQGLFADHGCPQLFGFPSSDESEQEETRLIKIVVFDNRRNVLFSQTADGWDLPMGQVEWDEDSFDEAAHRELSEICNLGLTALVFVGYENQPHQGQGSCPRVAVMAGLAEPDSLPLRKKKHVFLNNRELLKRVDSKRVSNLLKIVECANMALAGKALQDVQPGAA
jgi:ADP-ribose pyrophosphatase YjhB (NUDIX family)